MYKFKLNSVLAIEWIKNQKISFLFYLAGVILFAVGMIFKQLINIATMLFVIGFFIDSIKFLNSVHDSHWNKYIFLIFSIIVYFTYPYAEALANQTIYELVGENVSSFNNTIIFLKGLFFLPALVLNSAYVMSVLIAGIVIVSSVFPFFDSIGFSKYRKMAIHSLFYAIAFVVIFLKVINIDYELMLGKNFIEKRLIKYSYLPNRTCSNIEKNRFINFIDANKVSVASVNQDTFFNLKSDSNITFKTYKCVRDILR